MFNLCNKGVCNKFNEFVKIMFAVKAKPICYSWPPLSFNLAVDHHKQKKERKVGRNLLVAVRAETLLQLCSLTLGNCVVGLDF